MSFPSPSSRQAQVIWFALTALAVASTVAIIGVLFWAFGQVIVALSPVLWPMAVAAIIAFILNPVVEWLTARRVPRLRAILLVFGGAALLASGLLASILPRAIFEARDLAGRIPSYAATVRERVERLLENPPAPLVGLLPATWQKELAERFPRGRGTNKTLAGSLPAFPVGTNVPSDGVAIPGPAGATPLVVTNVPGATFPDPFLPGSTNQPVPGVTTTVEPPWWIKAVDPRALRTAGDWLATVLPLVGGWLLGQVGKVASWFGVVAGFALIPIYAFYFLLEKSSIERRWTDYLPVSNSRFKDELVWLLRNINDALIVFFRGQVLVAICDGVLYSLGFLVIGLPYALLLGVVATVLTIVPFLGAIVTCVSALIIAVVQFGDWQHPLLVVGVFVVVQTVEGWVIQPKIIGDRVGLHPITIIIALLVGTTLLGGILGGLLAIPATAVIRALMFRYVWRAGLERIESNSAT